MVKLGARIFVLRFLKLLVILLLGYTVLTCLWSVLGGFMDFPCSVRHDPERNCVEGGAIELFPAARPPSIQASLTTYRAGWSGGGCRRLSAQAADGLLLPSFALTLKRAGNQLTLNGKPFNTGQVYQGRHRWTLNPWVTEELSFKSLGLVSDCRGDPEVARVVLLGETGTELAPSHGLGLLVGLLAALGLVKLQLRRLRRAAAS